MYKIDGPIIDIFIGDIYYFERIIVVNKDIVNLYEEVRKASIDKKNNRELMDKKIAERCILEKYDLFCQKIRIAGIQHGAFKVTVSPEEWRKNYYSVKDCYILEALNEYFGIFSPAIGPYGITFYWCKETSTK
jgi:hypothetical protein